MTATTPVERVAKVLEDARFKRIAVPLEIGGVTIEASAAFIGEPPSPDLIVIGDTIVQNPRRLQHTIEGVGRALDMMGSRRPVTLIVVGPRPESSALTALSRHARVLTVGEQADDSSLANWLAVLLPLKLPKAEDNRAKVATNKLLDDFEDPLVHEFITLAHHGRDGVAARLAAAVDEPFDDDDDAKEEA